MSRIVVLVAIGTLAQAAGAETQDCKMLTDPALRLNCYDKINPPIASYPIPLPKPSHFIPLTRRDLTELLCVEPGLTEGDRARIVPRAAEGQGFNGARQFVDG